MIDSSVNCEQMRHVITPCNFTLQCNKSKYICWTVSLANKHQQKLPSESNWMMEWNKWKETVQTGSGWRSMESMERINLVHWRRRNAYDASYFKS